MMSRNTMEPVVTNPAPIKFTSSNSIIVKQVDRERAIEDTSSKPGRFLNVKQFVKVIGFVVAVVTQMSGSSEKQRNICLGLFAAFLAVYAMEHWVMTRKVIIFEIASNSTKLLCFYLLLCILKPEWLGWCGFIIVCISAITYTFSDELKTKLTWCCGKGVLVITSYVIDKVLVMKAIRKDQTSPASAPSRASV